jgi:hypothetical protein
MGESTAGGETRKMKLVPGNGMNVPEDGVRAMRAGLIMPSWIQSPVIKVYASTKQIVVTSLALSVFLSVPLCSSLSIASYPTLALDLYPFTIPRWSTDTCIHHPPNDRSSPLLQSSSSPKGDNGIAPRPSRAVICLPPRRPD